MGKYKLLKLSLFIVIACLWVSFGANKAQADAVITDLTISAGSIVVPAYSNSGILFCYNNCDNISVDSSVMSSYSCQNGATQLFYLNNPTVGSHTINKNSSQAQCFFVGGLDSITPISYEGNSNPNVDNYDTFNVNRNNTTANDLVIGLFGGGDSGSGESGTGAFTSASTTIINYAYSINGSQQHLVAGWQMANAVYNTWTIYTPRTQYPLYGNKADFFIELKPFTGPAPYCGDGICNGTETSTTCIDCLSFYDMTSLEDTYLWFDTPITYCPVNTSCQIKYHFDTTIFNPTADYGKLYYYQTSTSSPTFIKNLLPLATGWELGDLDGGSFVASSTSTSTNFSYYQIVPCKTFGTGECWGTSTIAIWYSAQPDYGAIISDLWVATSSTSTSDMIDEFNLTAYHLTCSDEQWSGDWWTKLGCYFRFGEVVLQKKSIDILNRSMAKTWSALKNMFPFNFANLVNTSWKNAKASDTPAELSFLDMLDDTGSISFDFSAMTGTTTKLKFWSSDTFDNTGGEFTKIRIISKYIFYGLLILYIYLRGKSVYKELIGNNNQEND